MDYEIKSMPFADAVAWLHGKQAVGSAMNSEAWRNMPLKIRTDSFFSSTLVSARAAQTMQDYIKGYLSLETTGDGDATRQRHQGRAEFVAEMKEMLAREGIGKMGEDGRIDPRIDESDLRDLRSAARLQLIFDTQTTAANAYAQWREGQDEDMLWVYPCWKFVRVNEVAEPRDYHEAALGEVRRKDDLPYWLGLNRDFGVPWAPWGFNSGCDVEDVDRDEAVSLGIIKENDMIRPTEKDFNEMLEASVKGLDERTRAWISQTLGNQVEFLGDAARPAPPRGTRTVDELLGGVDRTAEATLDDLNGFFNRLQRKDAVDGLKKTSNLNVANSKRMNEDAAREYVKGLWSLIHPQVANTLPKAAIRTNKTANNAYYLLGDNKVVLSPWSGKKDLWHELLHHLQENHPNAAVRERLVDYFRDRVKDNEIEKITTGGVRWFFYRDHWEDVDGSLYAGRVYMRPGDTLPAPKGQEMATTHLEKLALPREDFLLYWNHKATNGRYMWREAFIECLRLLYP